MIQLSQFWDIFKSVAQKNIAIQRKQSYAKKKCLTKPFEEDPSFLINLRKGLEGIPYWMGVRHFVFDRLAGVLDPQFFLFTLRLTPLYHSQ